MSQVSMCPSPGHSPSSQADTDSQAPISVCVDLRNLQRACENSASGGLGGVAVFIVNQWRGLATQNQAIRLYGLVAARPFTPRFQSIIDCAKDAELVYAPLHGSRWISDRLSFGRYQSAVRLLEMAWPRFGRRFDIIHSVDQLPAPRIGRVSVATIHDVGAFRGNPPDGSLAGRLARGGLSYLVRTARRIACPSAATVAGLIQHFPEAAEKFSVLPLGLDTGLYRPAAAGETGPKPADRGVQRPYFLHVGICVQRKNPDGILGAVQRLSAKYRGKFEMVFAGPYQVIPSAASYLKERARELGVADHIRIVGDIADAEVVSFYRSALALVFPSLYEGFGLPPLEALACGTPAIVSWDPASREVVGSLAQCVNGSDPDQIASAMASLLEHGAPVAVRREGPALAARYSLSEMAKRYLQLYRAALDDAAPNPRPFATRRGR